MDEDAGRHARVSLRGGFAVGQIVAALGRGRRASRVVDDETVDVDDDVRDARRARERGGDASAGGGRETLDGDEG